MDAGGRNSLPGAEALPATPDLRVLTSLSQRRQQRLGERPSLGNLPKGGRSGALTPFFPSYATLGKAESEFILPQNGCN